MWKVDIMRKRGEVVKKKGERGKLRGEIMKKKVEKRDRMKKEGKEK